MFHLIGHSIDSTYFWNLDCVIWTGWLKGASHSLIVSREGLILTNLLTILTIGKDLLILSMPETVCKVKLRLERANPDLKCKSIKSKQLILMLSLSLRLHLSNDVKLGVNIAESETKFPKLYVDYLEQI